MVHDLYPEKSEANEQAGFWIQQRLFAFLDFMDKVGVEGLAEKDRDGMYYLSSRSMVAFAEVPLDKSSGNIDPIKLVETLFSASARAELTRARVDLPSEMFKRAG